MSIPCSTREILMAWNESRDDEVPTIILPMPPRAATFTKAIKLVKKGV